MDAPRLCPDAELLAAFLDGTLVDYERTAIVMHLTECDQCRAVALAVVGGKPSCRVRLNDREPLED